MKIVISSTGKNIKSEVDSRFGRCNYFLIVEVSKKKEIRKVKAIKNTAQTQAGGAGVMASEIVGNEKPDVVLTVNTGPRAFQVLSQLRIKIYRAEGKIEQAVEDFMDNKLEEIRDANGPQHMGLR